MGKPARALFLVSAVLFATAGFIGGVAYAANTKLIQLESPHRFLAAVGLWGGATIGGAGTAIEDSYAGSAVVDFAELAGPNAISAMSCRSSTAITVTGAAFGDVCSAATSIALPEELTLSCFVSAANAVKVRLCAPGFTDAGVYDPASATYTVRVFDP